MVGQARDGVSCGEDMLDTPESVLAAALDAYIGIDAIGRVVAWNPAAESTFGYAHAEACHRPLGDLIIPARYREAHEAGLARLVAGGRGRVLGQRLEVTARHRDGHEFPIQIAFTATVTPAGRRFHAFAHDATATARARRFAAVESAVARGLLESPSSTVAADRVVEALGDGMGWPVAELWLVEADRRLLTCAGRHVGEGRRLGEFGVAVMEAGVGLPGRVYQQATAEWVPDLGADSRSGRGAAAARIGLRVAVGVPISTSGQTLGALCVYGDWAEEPEEGLITLLTGVSAQVGQYLERRRAEELTIELARTKDEFLAMVTHELRNPLAVVISAAELLDDDLEVLSADEQREHLHTVVRNAHRLMVMANDLLDLARLESGHLAIHPTPTDLCPIIQDAAQAVATRLASKDLSLTLRLPQQLPLCADAHRLGQVADNLLSNAVKYTPSGGAITLTADTDQTNQQITWTVADTGIGIPPADRPSLFRRFYRASTALEQSIPGTGLGLVITRAIIERHHGDIELTDHTGPGTTFTIHLPVGGPDGLPTEKPISEAVR